MSNFPLSYKLSWLPRLFRPSVAPTPGLRFLPMRASLPLSAQRPVARLAFVGDISAVAADAPPEVHPALRAFVAAADLVIGNCESPLVERPAFPLATRVGLRHAMGAGFLDGVIAAIGAVPERLVLSVANNHALDQGEAGFDATLAVLRSRGIAVAGSKAEGLMTEARAADLRIGLLAFSRWRNAALGRFAPRVVMEEDITAWKGAAEAGFDLVCALPHWDREFRHFPSPETAALAGSLAARGARLIVGAHAHVLQPVSSTGEALVAYGLGDLVGTALPRMPWPGRIGGILAVDVAADAESRGRIAGYELRPFYRARGKRRETLLPIESLEGSIRTKAEGRLAALFG